MSFRSGTVLFCSWRQPVAFWVPVYFQKLLVLFTILPFRAEFYTKVDEQFPFSTSFWGSVQEK